ncbi:MAG TPA: LacI family transcriptional regulator [Candidatus Faecalibacterium avium]|nr:LacI family transcriptional regulator [Candidatus Faecalibacterium avium]
MERVTIRDVAKKAGVSITTVSKALNDYTDVNPDTRKHIQEIARQMNYVPNAAGRCMGGRVDKVIGLLINDLRPMDPSGAVYGVLSGVCHACQDNNIEFILVTTDSVQQTQRPLKVLCLKKQLTGLVCIGFRLHDPYLQQLDEIDIPCAFIDIRTSSPDVLNITMDNERAAYEAVSFLIKNGRRNIALVNGSSEADVALLRGSGYRRALTEAGLVLRPDRMLMADFDSSLAYAKVKELLERDGAVDALFCASDVMALGACKAIEELGLTVGDQVAVVGFDDIPEARYLYGGLTTVRQDFYLTGYMAGKAIYEKIEGKADVHVDNMMYELVIRGSAKGKL